MPRRLMLSYQVFWAGLLVVLGAGIGSATVFSGEGLVFPLLTLAGGVVAVAARIWQRRLRRAVRSANHFIGLGEYPLELLRGPRFVS